METGKLLPYPAFLLLFLEIPDLKLLLHVARMKYNHPTNEIIIPCAPPEPHKHL